MWNAPNPNAKPKISNSQKDPFYNEKKALIEERKQKRLEQHQAMVEKNNQKYQEFVQKKKESENKRKPPVLKKQNNENSNQTELNQRRQSIASSSMSTVSSYPYQLNNEDMKIGQQKPQGESIMNLLTKNISNNVIYEDDEDRYLKPREPQRNINKQSYDFEPVATARFSRNDHDLRVDDMGSPVGFVPFMRTNEFLDPAHAGSPVPPSRESSAVKQDREKARRAYYKNQNPADYGFNFQNNGYGSSQHMQQQQHIQESNRNRSKVCFFIQFMAVLY